MPRAARVCRRLACEPALAERKATESRTAKKQEGLAGPRISPQPGKPPWSALPRPSQRAALIRPLQGLSGQTAPLFLRSLLDSHVRRQGQIGQGRADGFVGSMAARNVPVCDIAVLAIVAQPRFDFAFPSLG
jgi:hypothetical protein